MRLVDVGRTEDWTAIEVVDLHTLTVSAGPVSRAPGSGELLIAHTADGSPRAIAARCPHRGLPLDEFARHGRRPGTIVCTAHRCEFDVETGANLVDDDGDRLCTWPLVARGERWFAQVEDDGGCTVQEDG